MNGRSSLLFALSVPLLVFATAANGQASRTWVSGVGDDVNPCSRTAPCKTFAGAISKTAVGGEIDALDPGGFGAVTITKAITLDGGGGQVASVLVSGVNGIVVSAGVNDVVILRNLRINGISGSPSGGLNGIRFLSGKALHVEHCTIFGFTQNGIDVALSAAGQFFVRDSTIVNAAGAGVSATTSVGLVTGVVERSYFDGGGTGLNARENSRWTVSESSFSGNSGAGILASPTSATTTAEVNVERCIAAANATGIQSNANQTIRLSETIVSGNTTGLVSTGALLSFGNNVIIGNGTNGAPSGTLAPQ